MKNFPFHNSAIVYDRVNKFGGAERVLVALKDILGNDLYTLVHSQRARWSSSFKVYPSFFNKIGFLRNRHELLTAFAPLGFESFKFDQYDLVVSVTSSDAKAIITRPETLHVCYCLTPPRYLWEMDGLYTRRPGFGIFNSIARRVFKLLVEHLRHADLIFSSRPDVYIAISKEVQKRIKRIYKRESVVVYPPVDYDFFAKSTRNNGDYYLVVSRLVPYKKVSLVVKAFGQMDKKLIVVGDGSEMKRLKSMSTPNVTFVGQVSDEKLRDYYAGANALIFPQLEDFGITPLEAQACGTPVIAYGRGGALETIVDGKTGIFFDTQSSGAIMKAVKKFETITFCYQKCKSNAKKFDKSHFINNFKMAITNLIN